MGYQEIPHLSYISESSSFEIQHGCNFSSVCSVSLFVCLFFFLTMRLKFFVAKVISMIEGMLGVVS